MIVTFDPVEFRSYYPKFTETVISDVQLEHLFTLATTFIDNTDNAMIPYDPDKGIYNRKEILYLFVCHLATMELWPLGQTGPVQSATQGSVSVSYGQVTDRRGTWFNQTPCGRTLFMLLRPYVLGGRIVSAAEPHPYG